MQENGWRVPGPLGSTAEMAGMAYYHVAYLQTHSGKWLLYTGKRMTTFSEVYTHVEAKLYYIRCCDLAKFDLSWAILRWIMTQMNWAVFLNPTVEIGDPWLHPRENTKQFLVSISPPYRDPNFL